MSKFLTKLSMESADDQDSGRWVLTEALHYQSDLAKQVIIVPRGFQTDLASVPRIPFVYDVAGGIGDMASVVHDYLYASGMLPRKLADAVFREALKATGVGWLRRWILWSGVRLGGSAYYKE